jgi:hypothetical protein
MQFRILPTLLVLIVTSLLISCKNNVPKETRLIPKDAFAVVSIDAFALKDKLEKNGANIDSILGDVFKGNSDEQADKKFISNLRNNAGINWKEKIHFFSVQKKAADKSSIQSFNVLGSLEDAAKLEQFLQSNEPTKSKVLKKEKDFTYIETMENNVLAWNKEQFIWMSYSHQVKPYYDTVQMRFIIPEKINTSKEITAALSQMFSQKEDASIISVKGFKDLYKDKAEGYFFSTTNQLLGNLTGMPIQLPKMEELMKDNYTCATLAFEDGKIIAKSTTYPNSYLSGILKKYAGPTVNLSLIEHYPSEHINAIMMAAFNPEIFSGILKQLEVEGLVNEFLKSSGINTQELYSALKGDVAVVVSDLGKKNNEPEESRDEVSLVKRKPIGKLIINIPVGNAASFNKLMNKAVEFGTMVKAGKIYKGSGLMNFFGLYIVANDQNLIISSDSLTYTRYIQASIKKAINKEALDYFKGKSTVMYIDVANTLKGFITDTSALYNGSINTIKNTVKDVIASSENYDNGKINAELQISMTDPKQNSLVSIVNLFARVATDIRLQDKKDKAFEEKMAPSNLPGVIRVD